MITHVVFYLDHLEENNVFHGSFDECSKFVKNNYQSSYGMEMRPLLPSEILAYNDEKDVPNHIKKLAKTI